MDERERKKIRSNLDYLILLTECDEELLASLLTNRVLGPEDIDNLTCIPQTIKRAFQLYDILITRSGAYPQLLQALQRTAQTEALEILLETPSTSSSCLTEERRTELERKRKAQIYEKYLKRCRGLEYSKPTGTKSKSFGVRAPCTLFTGRQVQLANLHKNLTQSDCNVTVISQITSVSGLGGIGKTQLARRYVQIYGPHFDNNIIWMNADTAENLSSSFRQLASDVLGIPTKNVDGKEKDIVFIVSECYHYFSDLKCLFVFDNAEKGDYFDPYLPQNRKEIKVLITSRDREWGSAVQVVDLKVFQEVEAVDFVKNGLSISDECIPEIKSLVQTLQYFPLALQQAISFIKNERVSDGNYGIAEYLEEFSKLAKELLDSQVSDDLFDDYSKTTLTTWQLTVDKIARVPDFGPLAIEILEILAYFKSEGISRETFMHLPGCTEGRYGQKEVKAAVRLLVKYSMVDAVEHQSLLCVHRLVQLVTRLSIQYRGRVRRVLQQALHMLSTNLDGDNVGHAASVWKRAEGISELVNKYSGLPSRIIRTLISELRIEEAQQFGIDTLQVLQESPEKNHLSILDFEEDLSTLYLSSGNFDKFYYFGSQVYARQVAKFGEKSECALWSHHHMGHFVYFNQDPNQGFEMSYAACTELEKIVGISDTRLVTAYCKVAEMGCNVGQFELVTDILKRVYNSSHSSQFEQQYVINARWALMGLGVVKATAGSVEGVNILRELYSELDFSQECESNAVMRMYILNLLRNFALQLIHYNIWSEGHQVSQNLYKFCRRWFGESQVVTLESEHMVASNLIRLGKSKEAYQIFYKNYTLQKREHGEHHVSTLESLRMMAVTLLLQGHHQKALLIFTNMLMRFGKEIERNYLLYYTLKLNYALALKMSGCQGQALNLCNELKDSWEKKYGNKHLVYKQCVEHIRLVQSGTEVNRHTKLSRCRRLVYSKRVISFACTALFAIAVLLKCLEPICMWDDYICNLLLSILFHFNISQ